MEECFTDMTPEGRIFLPWRPVRRSDPVAIDTGYFYKTFTEHYVTVPAYFPVNNYGTTYHNAHNRNEDHQGSNAFHFTLWNNVWSRALQGPPIIEPHDDDDSSMVVVSEKVLGVARGAYFTSSRYVCVMEYLCPM